MSLLQLEAKKPDSFGALPTDSAFDAARLEFKLVDQTVLKAASSDLTRPFNDVCSLKTSGTVIHVHTCTDHTLSKLARPFARHMHLDTYRTDHCMHIAS